MESVIQDFIAKQGAATLIQEVRKILEPRAEAELQTRYHIRRDASAAEIERMSSPATLGTAVEAGFPAGIAEHGHYQITGDGEILLSSHPRELSFEAIEAINRFCRENWWTYDILPSHSPLEETSLTMVFRTRVFVGDP